jgi:hypothetical protein
MPDSRARYGAAAGALAIVLYVAGSLVMGAGLDFDAAGREVAADLAERRTRIQVGCAIHAAWPPLFVWFLATVVSLTRDLAPGARRAATVAFGCGLVFAALFLADVTALAVSALRPENMAAAPELAAALRDFEWLAMGMAAPVTAGAIAALAVLALRHKAIWAEWVGWLAAVAAALYMLRVGTLFTTDGPFAADGALGLYVPVAAAAGWILIASLVLALDLRVRSSAADRTPGTGSSRTRT